MQSRAKWLALCGGSLSLGLVLVLLRGRPSVDSDAGIFLSVAGRLLAGDRLYADVYDNKDPLFFYTFAGALGLGDWRLPFLLDALWLALAAVGVALLLRALGSSLWTAALGFVAYPLLLTGSYYYAGYSMLPALALAPLVAWLWLRGCVFWCGVLLGVGVLYKLNLALVLASGPIAFSLLRAPPRGRRAATAIGGLAGVLGLAALVLAALGELVPYVRVLRDNVSYADDVQAATGRPTGVYGHLWTLAGVTDHTVFLALAFAAGLGVALWMLARERDALCALFVTACATTGITLAGTAVWDHHAQMLAFPGVLLVVVLATFLARTIRAPLPRAAALALAVAAPLAAFGAFSQAPGVASGESWSSGGRSDTAKALDDVRARLLAGQRRVTYAALGENHEQGQAAFLHGDWKLACPRFHQYPFSRHLDAVVGCIRERRPELLLVTYPFARQAQPQTKWDVFSGEVAALLARSYKRVPGDPTVWALRR